MKKTIFFKIFSGYLIMAGSLIVIIIFLASGTIKNHYIKTLSKNLARTGKIIKKDAEDAAARSNIKKLREITAYSAARTGTRITIIDNNGKVLADSEKNPELMANHGSRPEIIKAYNGEAGVSVRYSDTVKKEMLYTALPMEAGEKRYVLRLSFLIEDVEALTYSLVAKISIAVIIIIVISLIAAYFISKRISGPLRELSGAAKKIALQDFDAAIDIDSGDETGEMAESFNYMTGEIKGLFRDLTAREKQLNTIISSIKEGLLVLDEKGRVEICNDSFKEAVGAGFTGSRYYWECMLPLSLTGLIEKSHRERKNISSQIEANGRVYLAGITFLSLSGQKVIILYDVTGIKEFENIKKDFVANVSHELKTPLTAIKGFAETLDGEIENKDNKHYLDIIKRHTERLINIVEDLLLLSNLEKKGGEKELEKINFSEIIKNSAKIFGQKVKKKKLGFVIEAEEGLPLIKGDLFKLEQMVINLIDNAVKYTDEGYIKISASKKGENIEIRVEDTGIGMPGEHIGRIFERFYVTDKSRSRKQGGTGLGLSIVKHIVLLHNGSIEVKSEPGKGTAFIISIPVK